MSSCIVMVERSGASLKFIAPAGSPPLSLVLAVAALVLLLLVGVGVF